MTEEIKYLDDTNQLKETNPSIDEKPTIKLEEQPTSSDKIITIPTWNLEPPLEMNRNMLK